MGWVDAVLCGILAFSVVVGIFRGLVFELMSLAGWVVAYFAAVWLAPQVQPHMPVGEPGSAVNHLAAFLAAFFAVLITWTILSRLVKLLLHATPLSLIDRLLGAVFGVLRGALVLLVVATVVSMTPFYTSPSWRASAAAPWLQSALATLKPMLPPQFSKRLPA
ncbi:MAG: hypothetical protein RLZZ618_3505 [Pseudomonadota bacterium]|jgi:membrane protein required for colicin V production